MSPPSGNVEPGGRRPTRRTFLTLATAFLATACTSGPQQTLRVAAGEPGGFYKEFADLLAGELPATVLSTTGSVANLGLVRDGGADLALTLADAAAAAYAGRAPFTTPVPLRAIGRVYENYMQLVVPADSPARSVADLAGRRLSLGAEGSGAALFGDRLLARSGVTATVDHNPLAEAVAELAEGGVDAILWSGGVPTPAIAELHRRRPIRLIDLTDQLAALQSAHGPVYERVAVPDGGYGHPVDTIGVPNLLVTHRDLPDDVAAAVAGVLVTRASRLVPPQALGTQYLDQRSLIATAPLPMHPGAATAYRDLRG
ncbi:TAXI family TRAP transporter solute-binding subunit [Actinophytocola glycyrrhizae]|uniref:TAXI family TRAP transporter solute-binding subunit n=1 Tax=Actinophytocola glycyrrhizae TaxID=2044873 RepID=A0ABV9SBH3_9PSEU